MKRMIVVLFFIAGVNSAFGQGITFKVRSKVFLNGNPRYPIMYSEEKEKKEEVVGNTYDNKGRILHENRIVKMEWKAAVPFDPKQFSILNDKSFLRADLIQSTDKSQVNIYFWPFKEQVAQNSNKQESPEQLESDGKKFNVAIKKGNFFIQIEERELLTFKTSALQAGPVTIPFKVYLSSRDNSHTSNVSSGVNAGLFLGVKWGKRGFVDLPAEEKGKTHNRYVSLNIIPAGFSKIDIDSKKNIAGSLKEGSVLGYSPALSLGLQYDSFGFFIASGVDLPVGNSVATDWRYKNQLWLGFGVGIGIF